MKGLIFTLAGSSIFVLLSLSFSVKSESDVYRNVSQDAITFPENIKAIIDAKCMGCHKPDAKNEKAKEKLQWEKVPTMSLEQQSHFIGEMFEVLEEGKMPPARSVERNPSMKLTDEETKNLLAWVESEEKRIKGE